MDRLGTPRLKTDSTGGPAVRMGQQDRNWHYPFGEQINASVDGVRKRFTGQERDAESGLDYFGARHYASALGRFISPDKPMIDQQRTDPQSWNLYAYVRNNPLRFIDPNGESIQLIGNEEEREASLQILKESLGNEEATSRLSVESGVTSYFVRISGEQADFKKLSATSADLANLVDHKEIVEFGVTSQNLGRAGGAATYKKGEIGNANVRVVVNPEQVRIANIVLSPATLLGFRRWAGQSESPPWRVQPFTTTISAWHEFGHAWGLINGTPNTQEALNSENRMRRLLYGPLGRNNAERIRH